MCQTSFPRFTAARTFGIYLQIGVLRRPFAERQNAKVIESIKYIAIFAPLTSHVVKSRLARVFVLIFDANSPVSAIIVFLTGKINERCPLSSTQLIDTLVQGLK